jgi:FkbM family methyltransferase
MNPTHELLGNMPRDWLENEFRKSTMVMKRAALNGEAVCRVLGKYPLEMFVNDIGCSTRLALDGFWEMWVTMAIAKHVQKGARCIDVGANVGYFTVLLGAVMECEVQAWEPQAGLCDALDCTIQMNGLEKRVQIVNAAAGTLADQGQKTLFIDHGTCNATLLEGALPSSKNRSVRCGAIDEENLARYQFDFIKIDAEGYEEHIIEGMAQVIAASPKLQICMEWTPVNYPYPEAFLQKLRTQFSLWLIEGDGELKPATEADATRVATLPHGEFEMLWLKRLP